jgi:uncharacterized protein YfiM (DUF2279 family)
MGALFLAALALAAFLPQPWKGRLATHGRLHFLVHLAAFQTAFLLHAWGRQDRAAMIRAACLLALFGALLEFMQTRVYGNFFEYRDVLADATGVALGFAVRELIRSAECIRAAAR